MADVLIERGLKVDTRTPLDFSDMRFAKVNEGLSLRGKHTTIEILRIEDRRTYNIFKSAQFLLGLLDEKLQEEAVHPPVIVSGKPFIVIIRRAENPEQVEDKLRKLRPQDDT